MRALIVEDEKDLNRLLVKALESDGFCTDNGVGISEDNLPLIWRRFWQADPSRQTYQGVGLGLSMVKEMVEFQGGKITASSQLDNGTTFTIVFPKQ